LVAEEDGSTQHRLRARVSLIDLWQHARRGRRAPAGGLPKAGGRRWCRPAARAARRLEDV